MHTTPDRTAKCVSRDEHHLPPLVLADVKAPALALRAIDEEAAVVAVAGGTPPPLPRIIGFELACFASAANTSAIAPLVLLMMGRWVASALPVALAVALASSVAFFWMAASRSMTSAGVSLMMSAYEKKERRRGDVVDETCDGIADGTAEIADDASSLEGIPPGMVSETSASAFAPCRASSALEVVAGVIVASVSRRPNMPSVDGLPANALVVDAAGLATALPALRGRIGLGSAAAAAAAASLPSPLSSARASAMPSRESSRIALSALGITAPSRDMLTGPDGPWTPEELDTDAEGECRRMEGLSLRNGFGKGRPMCCETGRDGVAGTAEDDGRPRPMAAALARLGLPAQVLPLGRIPDPPSRTCCTPTVVGLPGERDLIELETEDALEE